MQSDGRRQDGVRNGKLIAVSRWISAPYETGLVDADLRGREFCEEQCKKECYAWREANDAGEVLDPKACGARCPDVLPANRLALRCYQSAYWQFASTGMGDAVFPGLYVQTMLGDLGITGPRRVDVMERIKILDETRREVDRDDKGESIRGKRKKKETE